MTVHETPAGAGLPLVRISNVWKKRGANVVLKGVDLVAHQGTVVCLLGPSGAGKSTLLRCINAIELPDRGMIYLDGVAIGCRQDGDRFIRLSEREVSRQRADIGMVFQNFNLFPHMSVLDNIIDAPMRVRGESRAVAMQRAHDLLGRVGLADKAKAYPRHLSGGQQQRIAIARALAMQPRRTRSPSPARSATLPPSWPTASSSRPVPPARC